MALTPDDKALARAVDIITGLPTKRIEAARRGTVNSSSAYIPWSSLVALADAIEAARPGWIARTREIIENGERH